MGLNVALIGASGKIGSKIARELLSRGHTVTGIARDPDKIELASGMTAVRGDLTDPAAIAEILKGHDAVIITLGAGNSRKSTIRSAGTMNVIQAMQIHGVERLICQSTLGAHESWSNLNFFWKRIMFGLLLRPVFHDHELQESLVRASGLNWTIVRPGAFTDGPATNAFKEDFPPTERSLSLKISRADIAVFLSKQLSDLRYAHQAVCISN